MARRPLYQRCPKRIRPLAAPAALSMTGSPPVGIEILQRVIDGLNRL